MLSRKWKKAIVIGLSISAFLTDVITLVDFMSENKTRLLSFQWLNEIGFFRWGWSPVFVCSAVALAGIVYWKLEGKFFRIIVISISVVALVLALPWFWIMCFWELPI